MTSVVDRYYRRIIQNIDNVRMKFDISALLVKSKEHDSKIDTNKNNIAENLTLINSKSDMIEDNKSNIAKNLTLINSKSNIIEDNKNNIAENLSLINSKFETNKNNIAENLSLINSEFETNENNIAKNLTLINSNKNRFDNIENDIEDINTKVTNNYNITQINKNVINFKTDIIDNQITAINSTLDDLKTKNNNSKCSIENFYIYITLK